MRERKVLKLIAAAYLSVCGCNATSFIPEVYQDAQNFVRQIPVVGDDSEEAIGKIDEILNSGYPEAVKIYWLDIVKRAVIEKFWNIEDHVHQAIRFLLKEMSTLGLADALWRSQTVDLAGDVLADNSDDDVLCKVFDLLNSQRNGNRYQAQEKIQHIRKVITDKGLDPAEYE